MHGPYPLTRELVLIGGGHTHALVLRRWGMAPLPGARLTLINPGPTAPYTGMLPGFIAGHYDRDALEIDLVRLARFAGARLILGQATGIDRAAQLVRVAGRPPVPYDLASVNIGITSDPPALPGFAEHGVPAKPLGAYASRWRAFLEETALGVPPQVAVLGGGVGGVELAMAMAQGLAAAGHAPQVTVIERATALPGLRPAARAALMRAAAGLGVTLVEGAAPVRVTSQAVILDDGREIAARLCVGVAGARAQDWLAETGLRLDQGFIAVDRNLQSSDPLIFAAGDCAHLPDPRPKAGVYAVREAPVLSHNLRAALTGGRMRPYRPQSDYLKLISLGGKSAFADKWGLRFQGPWLWRWKDRIDTRFMDRFSGLCPMPAAPLPRDAVLGLAEALGDKPLCGGCGSKVGGAALGQVLARLPAQARDDVEPLPGDDAAVLRLGGVRQVVTTDHLRAFWNDPAVMARIAAVHALGDVWAMGARPQAALASLILPRMAEPMQAAWLDEIMAAASTVMTEAGAAIVGGHTTLGAELTIGFTVTGLLDGTPVMLAGARPGDALVLTKPIGSGVIMAAEMALQARGAWVAEALEAMQVPQGPASAALRGAHAMTDVTGFGLAGHLMNICEASGVAAELDLGAVPLLQGAEALAACGVRSSLHAANRGVAARMALPDGARAELLFDPQTAGGLLAAVPDGAAAVSALRQEGYPAVVVGRIVEGAPFIAAS